MCLTSDNPSKWASPPTPRYCILRAESLQHKSKVPSICKRQKCTGGRGRSGACASSGGLPCTPPSQPTAGSPNRDGRGREELEGIVLRGLSTISFGTCGPHCGQPLERSSPLLREHPIGFLASALGSAEEELLQTKLGSSPRFVEGKHLSSSSLQHIFNSAAALEIGVYTKRHNCILLLYNYRTLQCILIKNMVQLKLPAASYCFQYDFVKRGMVSGRFHLHHHQGLPVSRRILFNVYEKQGHPLKNFHVNCVLYFKGNIELPTTFKWEG